MLHQTRAEFFISTLERLRDADRDYRRAGSDARNDAQAMWFGQDTDAERDEIFRRSGSTNQINRVLHPVT